MHEWDIQATGQLVSEEEIRKAFPTATHLNEFLKIRNLASIVTAKGFLIIDAENLHDKRLHKTRLFFGDCEEVV